MCDANFSGAHMWTEVKYQDYEYQSCCLFLHRYDWGEEKKDGPSPCSQGSGDPNGEIYGDGLPLYGSYYDALSHVVDCLTSHKQEVEDSADDSDSTE